VRSLVNCCGICIPERRKIVGCKESHSSSVLSGWQSPEKDCFTEPVKRLKFKVFVRGLEIDVSSFECTTNSNHG